MLVAERGSRFLLRERARLAIGLVLLESMAGCAMNPVSGMPQVVLMSEADEIKMGQDSAPEIAASMGLYQDDELQRYVESVGKRMAALSERPQLPWQFHVIDDSAVNAFAVPGGFIYITRGILANMQNEAELASVVGHEIGHVTARHSVAQITRQEFANIGLGIGMVGLAVMGAGQMGSMLGQAVGSGVQVLFLKYSRDDETQADGLGLRYMSAAGYAPDEMPNVFHTLARQSQETPQKTRVPEWQSTHPAPENREQRIQSEIEKLPPAQREGRVDAANYLAKVNGIIYGPDPRAGYFDDNNVFHHPGMAFRMKFPKGWKTQNQPTSVVGVSPEQDAAIQLVMAKEKNLDSAASAFFRNRGIQRGSLDEHELNGLSAVSANFSAATQQGTVRGRTSFVELGDNVFQLIGFAPQNSYLSQEKALANAIASFGRETDPAALSVKPWRVEIVTPVRSMTVAEFAQAFPGPVDANELAIMNQVEKGGHYEAGKAVKRIVGQALP